VVSSFDISLSVIAQERVGNIGCQDVVTARASGAVAVSRQQRLDRNERIAAAITTDNPSLCDVRHGGSRQWFGVSFHISAIKLVNFVGKENGSPQTSHLSAPVRAAFLTSFLSHPVDFG
jgi:2-methylcitrate dehydratase PrpD